MWTRPAFAPAIFFPSLTAIGRAPCIPWRSPAVMQVEKQLAFSNEEFEQRLKTVRDAAASRGLDALVLFSPSNVYYLCGFFSVNQWDFQCLVVPLSGDPILVIREFEAGRFHASCRLRDPWTYPPEGTGPPAVIDALRHL